MRAMDAESIDAIVSDPPYGLSFMGKGWDHGVPGQDFWIEALRVAKPGAHLLAFGGTRTFHRLVVAIEDAGWEIRDCLMWVYGSGFPKSLNIGRGWGTALKPAYEPIIMARKPLTSTVAANVLKHGTGAINVDGCRVGSSRRVNSSTGTPGAGRSRKCNQVDRGDGKTADGRNLANLIAYGDRSKNRAPQEVIGRWPANVLHDGSDEVTGLMGDAARFFYCAKASKADRDEGCDGLNVKKRTDGRESEHHTGHLRTTERSNHHPTVKPTDLMRYLCRLVTPPAGTVLDPFMGSGSTGKAATLEGFSFVGCELQPEYMAIAEARILHAEGDVEPLLRVRS